MINVTVFLGKDMGEITTKPVKVNDVNVGSIISYDPITGIATLEIDDYAWSKISTSFINTASSSKIK